MSREFKANLVHWRTKLIKLKMLPIPWNYCTCSYKTIYYTMFFLPYRMIRICRKFHLKKPIYYFKELKSNSKHHNFRHSEIIKTALFGPLSCLSISESRCKFLQAPFACTNWNENAPVISFIIIRQSSLDMNSNALISFFLAAMLPCGRTPCTKKSHEPFCFVLKATVFKHVNIPILRKEIAWKIDNLRVYSKEIENLTKRNSLSSRPCSKRS